MTRDEFAMYIFNGTQWTPATLAAVKMAQDGMIPTCDIETFEREVVRPDGMIPFEKAAPLFRFGAQASSDDGWKVY